jgi:hypothetical protein
VTPEERVLRANYEPVAYAVALVTAVLESDPSEGDFEEAAERLDGLPLPFGELTRLPQPMAGLVIAALTAVVRALASQPGVSEALRRAVRRLGQVVAEANL